MASEVKEYFLELADKKRLVYMEEHGLDFYKLMQLEINGTVDYCLEFIVTDNDTKTQRTVTMRGSFTDMVILTNRLLDDEELSKYKTSYTTYELVSVTLVEN
ncbi:hypothetical protein qdsa001_155 [Staphylococcus phage qdsa001]|nr:hypothetical protein qdsa001_155 [Staphylococcus phage qdsa001]QXV86171.1 hypothetical protein [Staphylococcus phage SAPYZU_15]BEU75327.1 hypothetical protein RNIID_1150 [Staphylococcus phage phiRNIID]